MAIWDGLFGRRNVKLTDPAAAWGARSGSHAGKTVTPDTALQLSTAWACVRLLSETIGTLPLGVFRKDGKGSRTAAADHPLYELLHNSPNADQTAAEFWEGMVACLGLWGNGYAEKHYSGSRVTALEPLRPDRMSVRRDTRGARIYRYSPDRGPQRELGEDQVFHLRGFGVGGDVGLSPISYARETMGSALAADEAAGRIFAQGLQQSLFVDSGQAKLTPDQRKDIRALFEDFMGSSNAGKAMVLEAGMKPIPFTFTPEDAQLLQTRAFHVEEICRWFRVPPFMVGHTEKTTSWGTGLEQQMIGFLTFSLRPYLTRIEQAVRKQLIAPAERASVFAEFNLEGLLRADSTGRANLYASAAQNGWRTRDEIRALENLPPMPGGDVLTVQSNLVPLDQLGSAAPPPEAARSALRSWLFPEGDAA